MRGITFAYVCRIVSSERYFGIISAQLFEFTDIISRWTNEMEFDSNNTYSTCYIRFIIYRIWIMEYEYIRNWIAKIGIRSIWIDMKVGGKIFFMQYFSIKHGSECQQQSNAERERGRQKKMVQFSWPLGVKSNYDDIYQYAINAATTISVKWNREIEQQ